MLFNNIYRFWLFVVICCLFETQVILAQEYNFVRKVPASLDDKLLQPNSIAINSEENVFVIESSDKTIRQFDASGKAQKSINSIKTNNGLLNLKDPQYIYIDRYDNLYIYDRGLGKIIVSYSRGGGLSFVEKGNQLGQSDQIKGLVVDDQGNIYVLNGARKQVDVYAPDGEFLTWFSGGFEAFVNPLSIGISGNNEIYILDAGGPSIIMFDLNGNQTNFHRNFSQWEGAFMEDPVALGVFKNGDFLVLDKKSARTVHFSRLGIVLGSFGAKGVSGPGVFANPIAISTSADVDNKLLILDAGSLNVQLYVIESISPSISGNLKRMKMQLLGTSRPPALDLACASNGLRFAIPSKNHQMVIAYEDTSSKEKFIINTSFKDAVALACDRSDNLFVVDAQAKEILMFDVNGVQIRKFGKDIPVKLKEPSSIAIQKSGNVVVCDKGTGNIHLWDDKGVYQKIITSAENSVLEVPVRVQIDSKDQIYILDEKENCIFRTGSGGWPIAIQKLEARGEKPDGTKGKIVDFFIDPLDQIYILNESNKQIEIYTWDIEPVLKFAVGHPASGKFSLANTDRMLFDKEYYSVYCNEKGGSKHRILQFLVKPPMPEKSVNYSVIDGMLTLIYNKVDSRSVIGYGLLTKNSEGKDSLAHRTTGAMLSIDENNIKSGNLFSYDFVSLSNSDYSDASFSFKNYLGYADRLLRIGQYEEALVAYNMAIETFGASKSMKEYVSTKLTEAASGLSLNSEIGKAMSYVRRAFELNPEKAEIKKISSNVLFAYFNEMANRDDVAGIVGSADEMRAIPLFQPIVLNAIDSLCLKMGTIQNERTISNAIFLGKTILKWEPTAAKYANTVAINGLALFKLKSLLGVPSLELEAVINEASRYSAGAMTALRKSGANYLEELLIQLQILNASHQFAECEKLAVNELNQSQDAIEKEMQMALRMELALAYSGQNKHSQAILEYKRLLALQPENKALKNLLAEALISDAQYDESKAIYQNLLISDINNAYFAAQIGRIELLKGNFAEASFQLEKAVRQDPSDRSFYGPLARSFEGVSNYKKAIENYKIAAHYQKDLYDQSAHRIGTAKDRTSLQDDLFNIYKKIANISYQLGDYDESIEYWKKAIDINTNDASAHFGLATSAINAGLVYEAVNAFATASKLDPNNKKYQTEYENAIKFRDEVAKNEAPVNILDLQVKEIYPSLYHNYADAGLLPIGELVVSNNTAIPITPISVTVFVKELMDKPTQIQSPVLSSFSNTFFNLSALFNENILNYTESQQLQMEVEIEYSQSGSSKKVSKSTSFLLHGRNQINWSDKRRLAAFVAPSVEFLIEYDKKSDLLFKDVPTYGMNRTILQAMQTYSVLYSSNYVYSPDPVQSFAFVSTNTEIPDYLQYPAETMKRKTGDCDDLVALYSALLENAGVATAYIDVPGHVFMAFDSQMLMSDLSNSGLEINDVIVYQNKIWIPVETTLLGKHGFMTAWKRGAERYYSELSIGHFPEVVPMADARRIYRPSVYVPENFRPEPQSGKEVLDEYNSQLNSLLLKVNQTVIRNLESRYQTEPGNVYVKNKYATLLAKLGQEDKSERILLEALEISPSNPILLNNLGNVYLQSGKAKDAISYYTQASEIDKQDGEILINLCKAYLMEGNKQQAGICFKKAVELNAELEYLYDELKSLTQ